MSLTIDSRTNTRNKGDKPRIGISSCLLGNHVRYDGKNKHNDFIVRYLTEQVEFIAICPEVAIGLGVPRAPIQLIDKSGKPGAVFTHAPHTDVTQSLAAYAKQTLQDYPDLSGFIFKSRSPSCGLHDAPVFSSTSNQFLANSSGIFASEIIRLCPQLPVENEENLQKQTHLDGFIREVKCFRS